MATNCPFTVIDHVQLAMPAGAENAARAFYGTLLGMGELEKPQELASRGGCWFESGTVQLHLGVEADFRPGKEGASGTALPRLRRTDVSPAGGGSRCQGGSRYSTSSPLSRF